MENIPATTPKQDYVNVILQGDSLEVLKQLPNELVDCVVTSPPYWGLRDYGVEGQLGLEKTPEEYVAKMVQVFREIRRVLKKEGTLWLNLGDSYASNGREGGDIDKDRGMDIERGRGRLNKHSVIKPKDLVGIPWSVAFALRADGWYLRQDIIWHKPNPMPESVTDRCTKAHEYIFLLTKSPKYYFDSEAVQEVAITDEDRPHGVVRDREYGYDSKQKVIKKMFKEPSVDPESLNGRNKRNNDKFVGQAFSETRGGFSKIEAGKTYPTRNRRSVWTINTRPYSEAHFATFPEALIEPMVLAGCPKKTCKSCHKTEKLDVRNANMTSLLNKDKCPHCGSEEGFDSGVILDPFMGAGTTGLVAKKLSRNYLGIELNPTYIKMAEERISACPTPMF